MTQIAFPPRVSGIARRYCPPQLREDAVQEAWLAKLQGKSPGGAVVSFLRRERKFRQRFGHALMETVV